MRCPPAAGRSSPSTPTVTACATTSTQPSSRRRNVIMSGEALALQMAPLVAGAGSPDYRFDARIRRPTRRRLSVPKSATARPSCRPIACAISTTMTYVLPGYDKVSPILEHRAGHGGPVRRLPARHAQPAARGADLRDHARRRQRRQSERQLPAAHLHRSRQPRGLRQLRAGGQRLHRQAADKVQQMIVAGTCSAADARRQPPAPSPSTASRFAT